VGGGRASVPAPLPLLNPKLCVHAGEDRGGEKGPGACTCVMMAMGLPAWMDSRPSPHPRAHKP
jgi:hypothetical protein